MIFGTGHLQNFQEQGDGGPMMERLAAKPSQELSMMRRWIAQPISLTTWLELPTTITPN
jgi:hypothetical protein